MSVLGIAGVSWAASTGGSVADIPSPNMAPSQGISLGEEEIFDVSLATFHAFDQENFGTPQSGIQLAFRGCGCGHGCGGGGRGCGCGGAKAAAGVGMAAVSWAEAAVAGLRRLQRLRLARLRRLPVRLRRLRMLRRRRLLLVLGRLLAGLLNCSSLKPSLGCLMSGLRF